MKLSTVTGHAQVSEKSIERHLVDRCKAAATSCRKLLSLVCRRLAERKMAVSCASKVLRLSSSNLWPRAVISRAVSKTSRLR